MSPLRKRLDDYLAVRRALGYKLERAGKLLVQFLAFLDEHGAVTITTELALQWATQPVATGSNWHSQCLAVIRGFATWLHAIDPACEVPPPICCAGVRGGRSPTSTAMRRSPRSWARRSCPPRTGPRPCGP